MNPQDIFRLLVFSVDIFGFLKPAITGQYRGPFFVPRWVGWPDLVVGDFAWSWIVRFSGARPGLAVVAADPWAWTCSGAGLLCVGRIGSRPLGCVRFICTGAAGMFLHCFAVDKYCQCN